MIVVYSNPIIMVGLGLIWLSKLRHFRASSKFGMSAHLHNQLLHLDSIWESPFGESVEAGLPWQMALHKATISRNSRRKRSWAMVDGEWILHQRRVYLYDFDLYDVFAGEWVKS